MSNLQYTNLFLTCKDQDEATKIADALLNDHLITCARFVPITSRYWWEGKIVGDQEVLVIMESREDLFKEVEAKVSELHSYDTFILQSVPLSQVSQGAAFWLDKELKPKENR